MSTAVRRAAFPWYDLAVVRWANDILWQATRRRLTARGIAAARELDRTSAYAELWSAPDLAVSQACGLDVALETGLRPIMAPVFDLECPPGTYFSHIVVRPGVSLGNKLRAAVNSRRSRSGFLALVETVEPGELVVTGSHQASLRALRDGHADVAAIDAATWSIFERLDPDRLLGCDIVARSSVAPSPPFVVSREVAADAPLGAALIDALAGAFEDPSTAAARRALGMHGLVPVRREDYAAMARHPRLRGDG